MRRFVLHMVVAALGVAVPVVARSGPSQAEEAALSDAIAADAEALVDLMVDAVNGHGGPCGLTADALDGAIALERAEARATFLRRLQRADLDWDGRLTPDEVSVAAEAASASARARHLRLVERVDGDADGTLSAAEIAAAATEAAFRDLPEKDAATLRAALALDADGNGLLDAGEAREGIARLVVAGGKT